MAIVGFLLGGPITAAVLFFVWKSAWSNKIKVYTTIIFVAIFNLLQIIFAQQIIGFTYEQYARLLNMK